MIAEEPDVPGLADARADVTYADELVVEVVAVSDDRMTTLENAVVWVEASGVSGPAGWVEQSATDALGEVGISDGYYLDYRRSVTEWGASGAVEHLVVTLAEGVFVESALLLAGHVAGRVAARIGGADAEPLSEEDAVAWARTRVAIKYGLDADDLTLATVGTREDNTVNVGLVGTDGLRFDLRLGGLRAGVRVVECIRTFPGPPGD